MMLVNSPASEKSSYVFQILIISFIIQTSIYGGRFHSGSIELTADSNSSSERTIRLQECSTMALTLEVGSSPALRRSVRMPIIGRRYGMERIEIPDFPSRAVIHLGPIKPGNQDVGNIKLGLAP